MIPTPPSQPNAPEPTPQPVPPERALRPVRSGAHDSEDTTRELYTQLIAMLGQENVVEAQAQRRFSLHSIGQVLRRRWLPMLIVFVAAGLGLSRVLKPGRPMFNATASLLLPPPNSPGGNQFLVDDGSDSVTRQYDTEAQIAILTSPEIIARALKYLSPELRVAGWGDKDVREAGVVASAPISENIIDITAFSFNAEASQRLANAVGGVYKLDTEYRTQNARKNDLEFTQKKVSEVSRDLETAKENLRNYKEQNGVSDLASQTSSISARVQDLQQRAADARLEANAGTGAQSIASDSTLTTLRQKADAARTAYENLNRDFQPTAPRVVKARQELQDAETAYQQRLSSLQTTLQERSAQLEAQLSKARSSSAKLPTLELELGKLNARVEQLSATYRTLSDRLTQLNLAKNAHVALPTFLRPAVPEAPSRFSRLRYLALSAIGALIFAILAALLLEKMDRGIHSPADLQKVADAPLLGALPALPAHAERRLTHMASVGAKAEMLEACYALRSQLVDAAYKNGVRSILITSATTDDGKSLCALNVATALAYDGHRVLLVDSDFWNPSQHAMAEVPLEPGYSDILQGRASFDEAVQTSRVRNLWLLPSGARPENILQLMESDLNRTQLQAFKDHFDFVIIDSPPTLSLADAQILSSLAEAVTLVVAESTPADAVQRAQAVLRLTGSHLLGIILNNDKSGATFTGTTSRALAPVNKIPPARASLQDGR